MKNPLAIIFNDAHLKTGNEEEVIASVTHLLKYAQSNKIQRLIFAGDLFDSRSFQRQSVLQAFDRILTLVSLYGCKLYIIPGNHDKTIYKSFDSFLDVYRYHPSVEFFREATTIEFDGVSIELIPFFSDDMLIPMLEASKGADILISHFEMAGSTHLGKVSTKTSINKKLLKKWKKTYLGHYHNHHEITKDIVHLPSLRQANFGEDNKKGFSVLYDDLSYELIQGLFKEFVKISININTATLNEIRDLTEQYRDSPNSIRFEFTGDESKLKALDKTKFRDAGIDVKIKYKTKYNYDEQDLELPKLEEWNTDTVKASFKQYCEDKDLDYKEGIILLEEFLNKDNE